MNIMPKSRRSKLSLPLQRKLKGGREYYQVWSFKAPSGKEVTAALQSHVHSDVLHIKHIALHKENGPELDPVKQKYEAYVAYHGEKHKNRWYGEPIIDFLMQHHLPEVHNWLQLRLPARAGFSSLLRKRFIAKSMTIQDKDLRYIKVYNSGCQTVSVCALSLVSSFRLRPGMIVYRRDMNSYHIITQSMPIKDRYYLEGDVSYKFDLQCHEAIDIDRDMSMSQLQLVTIDPGHREDAHALGPRTRLPNGPLSVSQIQIVGQMTDASISSQVLLLISQHECFRCHAQEALEIKFSAIRWRLSLRSDGCLGPLDEDYKLLSFERDFLLTLVAEEDRGRNKNHVVELEAAKANILLGFKRRDPTQGTFVYSRKAEPEYDRNGRRVERKERTWLEPVTLMFSEKNFKLKVKGTVLRQDRHGNVQGMNKLPRKERNVVKKMNVDKKEGQDQELEKFIPRRRSKRIQSKRNRNM